MDRLSFYNGKRVFITGHTGFKGAWLTRLLLHAGAEVTGYALAPETTPSLFGLMHPERDMHSILADVRDFERLRAAFDAARPEIVLHLAAQPIVRESYRTPRQTYETNVMGTVNLLECVRLSDTVRSVVNVTTDKVYENRELGNAFCEEEPLKGYDPYSNSKSCSELVTYSYNMAFFRERGLPVSTARAGNVIGGGDFSVDRIIPDCVRAAMAKAPVGLRNPASVRPYQHVLDPLYAYLTIAQRQYAAPSLADCYNVGPDRCDCVNTGALAELFCKAWGDGMHWVNQSEQNAPHEAGFLMLDCDKMKRTFGWNPRLHIDEAVQYTVEWTKNWLSGGSVTDCMDAQIKAFEVENA